MLDEPFKRVIVNTAINGGTSISWTLNPRWRFCGTYIYTVQVADSANTDNWENVETVTPITYADESIVVTDTAKRLYSSNNALFYRVKLDFTPTGGTQTTYYSNAAGSDGAWESRDWVFAREITRKELLRFKKVGVGIFFFKKRINGNPCPRCLDFDTGEVKDSNCPVCLGTGYELGYYNPLTTCCELSLEGPRRVAVSEPVGKSDLHARTARIIAYPYINTEDVLVVRNSDKRYRIQRISTLVEVKAVPVVLQLELREIPRTDPVYSLITSDTPAVNQFNNQFSTAFNTTY